MSWLSASPNARSREGPPQGPARPPRGGRQTPARPARRCLRLSGRCRGLPHHGRSGRPARRDHPEETGGSPARPPRHPHGRGRPQGRHGRTRPARDAAGHRRGKAAASSCADRPAEPPETARSPPGAGPIRRTHPPPAIPARARARPQAGRLIPLVAPGPAALAFAPPLHGRPAMTTPPELAAYLDRHPETRFIDAVLYDLCGTAIGKRLPRPRCGETLVLGRGLLRRHHHARCPRRLLGRERHRLLPTATPTPPAPPSGTLVPSPGPRFRPPRSRSPPPRPPMPRTGGSTPAPSSPPSWPASATLA